MFSAAFVAGGDICFSSGVTDSEFDCGGWELESLFKGCEFGIHCWITGHAAIAANTIARKPTMNPGVIYILPKFYDQTHHHH